MYSKAGTRDTVRENVRDTAKNVKVTTFWILKNVKNVKKT